MAIKPFRSNVIAAAAIGLFAFAGPALAAEKKSTAPPAVPAVKDCRGVDMLDELKASDPDTHARILTQAQSAENANALFWKIEREGLTPSYLFGTIHLTDQRVNELPEPARTALGKASSVLLEIADLSPQGSASALAQAMQLAIYTDGNSLEKLLTPEEFKKVQDTLAKAGLPADAARLFRPWIVTMLLAASDCERRKIQEGTPVLDMKIAEIARSNNTPVAGLESIDTQLAALASIPENQQTEMLKSSLVYADRTYDLVETTIQFYMKRNMGAVWPFQLALARKAGYSEAAFAGVQETLISERNAKMRDGALPHIEKGAAFIAVGALHLPGKSGLVQLLRDKGYTMTAAE